MWHTLSAVTADGRAIVSCVPDTAGAAAARLDADFSVGATAGGVMQSVGVGVGAGAGTGTGANYTFRNLGSRADLGEYTAHYTWAYDPFGRKVGEACAPYGAATRVTLFGYDGLRQLETFDVTTPASPVQTAMYLYGPGGLDDLVAMQFDNGSGGGFDPYTEAFTAHTDAQHSVVALTRLLADAPRRALRLRPPSANPRSTRPTAQPSAPRVP